ncbi:Rne/Rng family ribonuclease [Thermomonospora umbrina]|uniref:Ribonuclease E n=1 Tax=Thermomonospora umbrina TaxID=111806 RepID=A0A3D9SNP4_9ACTN|nr:Rne/Rng family ribonuclease [Thermomonospora umbrina]REE95583.1 ribonuclease E [Thermomonospora umbrina]
MDENETDSANTENPDETMETSAARARRRAASRPAGPPPEVDDTPPVITPAAPPAAAAPEPPAAEAEPGPAPQAAERPARATTRRKVARRAASAPAEEPEAPATGAATDEVARRGVSAPAAAAPEPSTDEEPRVQTSGPAEAAGDTERPARKVARRGASAPPEEPETERPARKAARRGVSAPAEEPEAGAEESERPTRAASRRQASGLAEEAAAGDAERPARKVARRGASAPPEEPEAAEESERPARKAGRRGVSAPAEEPEAGAEETGRSGRRAARRGAGAPVEEPVAEVPDEEAAPAEKPARATRSRSRKAAAKTPDTETEVAASEDEAEGRAEPARTRTRRRAAEAVPPVPEVPAAPTLEVPADAEAPGVPTVTFQPPMVVFQPPQPAPKAEAPPKHAAVEDESEDIEPVDLEDEDEEGGDRPRRRRRRGGRGRGKADRRETGEGEDEADEEPAAEAAEPVEEAAPARSTRTRRRGKADRAKADDAAAEPAEEAAEQADETEDADEGGATSRRRRRRRRRTGVAEGEEQAPDDPPNTVVHVRSGRAALTDARDVADEVQSVKGSTRLEAKKQRRREGREQGRRRPPVITESEFLARRESVERVMVIRQLGERTQIAVLEDDVLVEHYVDRATHQSYVGNVYLGKVQNVLPSMEAAFVDIGKGRNAVLYAGEVNWDVAGLVGQPRRIESALRSGQSVLVQVTKDPLGHKGARLTSQVSLPGRYLVYVPDGSMTGISRKLPDKERTRLKQALKRIMPENAGVIVRTAAEGAAEEELEGDVSRLAAQWEHIQRQAKNANAPALLHGEPDLTIRVVRDIFNEDFAKLVVDGDDAWDMVAEYVQYVAPHLADRVERWDGPGDVLGAYRIDEQIAKALERKVWLPSGGSLVIDRTEAMTVVDVNTGKFTGQGGNLEETVTRNNLEAAEEIVRQLRLRDVGGIIVIDFIDMVLESNRELVLRRLLECLSRDRTKHQVAEVTSLGLVQMTRKRVGQGLLEAFSEVCECCNGRGVHVQTTPVDHTPDKSAASGGGRRRKRKGDVEKAVEEKLARHETDKDKDKDRRAVAKREAGPPPEPDEPAEGPADAAEEAADAAVEATETVPATLDAVEPDETGEPETTGGTGRRRRARRSRAKSDDRADDKAGVAEPAAAES